MRAERIDGTQIIVLLAHEWKGLSNESKKEWVDRANAYNQESQIVDRDPRWNKFVMIYQYDIDNEGGKAIRSIIERCRCLNGQLHFERLWRFIKTATTIGDDPSSENLKKEELKEALTRSGYCLFNPGNNRAIPQDERDSEEDISSSSESEEDLPDQAYPVQRVEPEDKVAPEGTDEHLICSICKERLKNTIIQPCNHRATCKSCTKTLKEQDNSCPICRGPIKSMLTYFDA